MIKFVNAKINLGLNVIRRREDGYHDLSTLFYPVGIKAGTAGDPGRLNDILEVIPASQDILQLTSGEVDCSLQDNLVWRALQLYRDMNPELPSVHIFLDKQLPSQAGLGGGSADASFTLLALNELADTPLSHQALMEAALRLGADCPFFIINRPCLASGVGECLTPVSLDLSGLWLTVIKPSEGISTGQAFRYVTPQEPSIPIEEIIRKPIDEWKQLLVNDFEVSMFHLHPEFRELKTYLYNRGAAYASMSGSGSAFYGIFYDRESAVQAAAHAPTPYATATQL